MEIIKMKKQILNLAVCIILTLWLISNILALDKSLGLNPNQIGQLEIMGIKNIQVQEYPCQSNTKCYALDGDIKEKLIEIPTRVKDNCIQNTSDYSISKIINNKSVTIVVKQRICTGIYNYRDITQKEIDNIIEKAVKNKVENKLSKQEDIYYPIKENTNIKEKAISIGISISGWINKVTKGVIDSII